MESAPKSHRPHGPDPALDFVSHTLPYEVTPLAVLDAVLHPSSKPVIKIATLATVTSTAAQELGLNQIFSIIATGAVTVRFGASGVGAADATHAYIAANTKEVYDTGAEFTHVRIFNTTGGNVDAWIQPLSRN